MKSIILFFLLFITCASATDHSATDHSATDHSETDHSATDHSETDHSETDHSAINPTIQIVSDKDPCGCTARQITFIKDSITEAEAQLMTLNEKMEEGPTIELKALAGLTSKARREQNMKILTTVATHLEEAGRLKIINKITDINSGILNVICKDPTGSQATMQGQGTLHEHILHLGPAFFLGANSDESTALVVRKRVKKDINTYAEALKTHEEPVTPFKNDQYPMLMNPGSIMLRFVLSSGLLTGRVLRVPPHQNYKGDNNVLMWMALAFITEYKEEATKSSKIIPKKYKHPSDQKPKSKKLGKIPESLGKRPKPKGSTSKPREGV